MDKITKLDLGLELRKDVKVKWSLRSVARIASMSRNRNLFISAASRSSRKLLAGTDVSRS